MGVIIFNGMSSADCGISVEKPPNYEIPERNYLIRHVPGKNGDILIDTGSYSNVTRTYDISVGNLGMSFDALANIISEWLTSPNGYARLEDSYEPNYFRMAVYKDSLTIENILQHAGRASLSFYCKPQRYLKTGEEAPIYSGAATLVNPTKFSSLPLITIRGSGSGNFQITGLNGSEAYAVSISDIPSSGLTIDSEVSDCYYGAVNLNPFVSLTNGFPRIAPGFNNLTISGGILSVEVKPRWWTL
jgi:phage-related protein